jgi:hypothetical protein
MGARVLIKKNNITYIGIDVFPDIDPTHINPYNTCIHAFGDIIIAKNNQSKTLNLLDAHPEWFKDLINTTLTKFDVIQKVINPLYKEARRMKILNDENTTMENGFFILNKTSSFQVLNDFALVEITQYASFSHEEMIMYAYSEDIMSNRHPKEIIYDILDSMYHHLEYIGHKFVIFDNHEMKYEFFGGD